LFAVKTLQYRILHLIFYTSHILQHLLSISPQVIFSSDFQSMGFWVGFQNLVLDILNGYEDFLIFEWVASESGKHSFGQFFPRMENRCLLFGHNLSDYWPPLFLNCPIFLNLWLTYVKTTIRQDSNPNPFGN